MRKICARLYLFLQCTIYAQDLCKIVLISSMCNICARFAQDCTSFPNAQYMYLFLQCAIYAQDCTYFLNAQYMHKICARLYFFLNICTRFAQDCTYFSNVQYMHKIVLISSMCNICTRLYFFLQCAIYAQDLCKIVVISPVGNICARFAQDCTYFSNAQYMRKI